MNGNTGPVPPEKGKKRILVLFGSPHRGGTTARLLREFLEPFGNSAEVRTVRAYESAVGPCVGCGFCTRAEGCCFRDDFDGIDALLRRADLLVVATPVYALGVPAPLKAIVDRMQRYFSARFSLGINPPIAKHRPAVLLVTCGSGSEQGAQLISRQLKLVFSVMNTSLLPEIVWEGTDLEGGEKTFPAARERARALALAMKCEL